jgi:two-component system LytT family sensor kinase
MEKRVVQIVIHIAAWVCFLMVPFIFYPRPREMSFFTEKYFLASFIITNILLIAFYYLNTFLFIPKWLDQKKFLTYGLIILLLLIFFGCLPRIYHFFFGSWQPPPPGNRPPGRPRNFQQPLLSPGNIAVFLLIFVFSTGIKVINQWLRSEQRNKEIASEKVNAELSFLKAQINPHFLFNTLNNIYALASAQSEKTAPAVMKLSSIMRYVLTEARNDMVPMEKEIQFTTHYIELQKMRLTDKSTVDFTVKGDPLGRQIAPLLLLPFVENAFKYGVSTREISPIRILLEIKKDSMYFSVSNHKHINTSLKVSDNTGIGINNTRRRLDLLYPDHYELTIDDRSAEFTVHLNIQM